MKTVNVILLALLAIGSIAPAEETKSPAVLLQQGIYAEETEGNLDKAIEVYTQIRTSYNDVERIAARATYQTGMCYLKKGDPNNASKYFEEVIDYFPEQKSVVEKAQGELKKIKPVKSENYQSKLIDYLRELHTTAYYEAQKKSIAANTTAYYIDESLMKIEGGFIDFKNTTSLTINSEVAIGTFDQKNIQYLYDENLIDQQVRYESTADGKFVLKWTPREPLNPGQSKILLYKTLDESVASTKTGCRFEMKNRPGPAGIQNFVLILPANMKITDGLDNLNSHRRIDYTDVYMWQNEAAENEIKSKTVEIEITKEFAESAKPAVAETFPVTYSTDIDPGINEIKVTFDANMFQHGWAWCRTGGPDIYPQVTGTPKYIDDRTCVLPVKVEPARPYLIIINSGPYEGFKNTDMVPAKSYAIVFATKDTDGKATKIPDDLMKKAQEINKTNAAPEPVLDIVPPKVREYIVDSFYKTFEKAQEKGLSINSHINIIDANFNREFGLVQIFKNSTALTIDREISMGSNDSPDMYIYDEKGIKQKIRTFKIPNSNYRYFWTPSEPIEPKETRLLFYSTPGASKLYSNETQEYALTMQNHYGSPVIEDFYLVVPTNIEITSQSEPFTSRGTAEGFDIYCWSQEQGTDVVHKVEIKLSKKNVK